MIYPQHSRTALTPPGAVSARQDRVVHASLEGPEGRELVRYDRQGRWYVERPNGSRQRMDTVHEAVRAALNIEADGGTIHIGLSGGKQFDAKVAGARSRR